MKAIFTLFVRIVSFAVVSLSFSQIIIDICNPMIPIDVYL